MLAEYYEIPEIFLENSRTDMCSDQAFKFWIGLIETSLLHFPEKGVFRYPWRVLSSDQLMNVHNAVSRFPVYNTRQRSTLFNELCECGLIGRRSRDGAYFIKAALHAKPAKTPLGKAESRRI